MKTIRLKRTTTAASLAALLHVTASAITLPVQDDTASTATGTLTVAAGAAKVISLTPTTQGFFKFDMTALAGLNSAAIKSARLKLFLPTVTSAGNITAHIVTGPWNEKAAMAEPAFIAGAMATITAAQLVKQEYVILDVRPFVVAHLNTGNTTGIALSTTSARFAVATKEGAGSGHPPELEIEVFTDFTEVTIPDGSLTGNLLAPGAVTANNLATGAVGNNHLADGIVTGAKMASETINAEQIASAAITSVQIANGSVLSEDFNANIGVWTKAAGNLSFNTGNVTIGPASTPQIARLNVNGAPNYNSAIFGSYLPLSIQENFPSVGFNTYYSATDGAYKIHSTGGTTAYGGLFGFNPFNGQIFFNTTPTGVTTDHTVAPQITAAILDRNGNFSIAANAYKPGGGSWLTSSDARLKKNIRPLDGALERLLQLRSVSFEYNEPEKIGEHAGTQIGFIAQEVEKVFPGWVATRPDGYKAVGTSGFESLAVAALRELRAEKDAQIKALEDRLRALEQTRR